MARLLDEPTRVQEADNYRLGTENRTRIAAGLKAERI